MSLVKNISGGALDVPLLDRQVEADETVEVPDFQPASTREEPLPIVWPPDKWEPVTGSAVPGAAAEAVTELTADDPDTPPADTEEV